jgi:hypothetical protein
MLSVGDLTNEKGFPQLPRAVLGKFAAFLGSVKPWFPWESLKTRRHPAKRFYIDFSFAFFYYFIV